jgi:hypothetical protein
MPATPAQIAAAVRKVKSLDATNKTLAKRVKALEVANRDHKKRLTALEKWADKIAIWGADQTKWTKEVTGMLRAIDWARLSQEYNGGGSANPPQDPPDWPGGP